MIEKRAQNGRRLDLVAGSICGKMVGKSARTRTIGPGEDRGMSEAGFSERFQKRNPAFDAGERIFSTHLKGRNEIGFREVCKPLGINPPWVSHVLGKSTAGDEMEAGDAKAFRGGKAQAGSWLGEAPAPAASRIEQHRNDRQIESGARFLRFVCPRALCHHFLPARDPSRLEMPPA